MPAPTPSFPIQCAVTFVAVFATGFLGVWLPVWGAHFQLPILPCGVAVAVLYRWGRAMGFPVFLAVMAFELSARLPLVAALGAGLGLAGGGLLSVGLLRKNAFLPDFGRRKDVLVFLLAVTTGMTVASTVGVGGMLLAGVPSGLPDGVRWMRWWSNSVASALLVSPALIAVNRHTVARFFEQWVEGACWVAAVVICCSVIAVSPGPVGRSVLVMAAILIIVVGAIRLGLMASALGGLVISCTTGVSFAFGFGMFGTFSEFAGRLTLFSFSATLVAASLIITALLTERDAAALEKLHAERALIDALAGEQRRIAGEIHDGLGQELTGLALSLRALATRAQRNQQPGAADLDDLAKLAARCIEGSKRIVLGLSPLNDAGGSLESALEALARRVSLSGTPVHFHAHGVMPLAIGTEALDHLYRIAQEAVQNALKHAAASAIDIELKTGDEEICLSIEDDGRGLPAAGIACRGLGMRTMRSRAAAVGGTLSVETLATGGTAVHCRAPQSQAMA